MTGLVAREGVQELPGSLPALQSTALIAVAAALALAEFEATRSVWLKWTRVRAGVYCLASVAGRAAGGRNGRRGRFSSRQPH